jgi:hypothetical protein
MQQLKIKQYVMRYQHTTNVIESDQCGRKGILGKYVVIGFEIVFE